MFKERICRLLSIWIFLFVCVGIAQAQAQVPLTSDEKAWLADHPVLKLGVGIAFPPYMWVETDQDQPVFKGMVSDYVDLLGQRLGLDMQIVFNIPFNEALDRGKNRQIDFFPCLSKTPERSDYLRFTDPYLSYPLVIITREDAALIGGLGDLTGKRFAAVKHLFVYSKLKNDYPNLNLDFLLTEQIDENLEAVSIGRADACIVNLAAASYYIQKKGLTNLRIASAVDWKGVNLSMGVRKDWPLFHGIVQKALASITQAEKDEISQRWIRVQYKAEEDMDRVWNWALGVGAGAGILFALVFAWNRRLQSEINERLKVEAALKESQQKLTNLIGNLSGIAFRCVNDEDWTMSYLSDGCLDLTGYKPSDLISNRELSYNDLIHPGDRQFVWDEVQLAVEQKQSYNVEYRIRDKGGNEKWVWEKGICLPDYDRRRQVLEGFITDISQRKKVEKEKEILESQLRHAHKMEAIGTLAGGIAHEFNNILGIILGNAELAMSYVPEPVPEDDPSRDFLREIKNASLRARNVVKQLLSFSRTSTRRKHPVALDKILREAMVFLRASIPANIRFQEKLTQDCYPIMADPTQLHQLIINLCNNSAHAMEEEGGSIEISMDNTQVRERQIFSDQILVPGDYLRLIVSDTGYGMEDEVLNKAFDPFYTTKDVDEGSGLGLAVVYGIVKEHGGFISIKTMPGHGTKVSCFFPPTKDIPIQGVEKDEKLPRGKETILFVDDEPALVKMGKRQLEGLGYGVNAFTDPEQALAVFRKNPEAYDLVITDYAMPKMAGDRLIKELKQQTPDLPAIICTGYSKRISQETASGIGAQGFLMKPVDLQTLARMVRNLLDKGKIRGE